MTIPDRFPAVLTATAMGVYLLLVVGATTSLTEAAAACTGWPACGDGTALPTETAGWIALGHRVLAVAVGLLVAASAALAWTDGASRRVRVALAFALLVFPAQAGVGALVAVGSLPAALAPVHLLLGVIIFGAVLAGLAWWLEAETGDDDDAPVDFQPGTDDLPPVEEVPEPDIPTATLPRLRLTAGAYFRLMKPRLMWLLCLVAAAAMALAGGPGFTPSVVAATLAGGALSIGASGTFNHVLERDVDKRMQRTSDRPLATDLVPVPKALAFGLLLTAVSLGLFWTVNPLTAALGLIAILFYSVVYTLILKPNTVQNTVIGGAAGALPALIGWAAVTGEIGGGGLLLALVIFLWTPAHFYNLALAYKDDYERGGFPMMPVVRGETATRRHIVWYLGATLIAAAALAVVAEPLGGLYAAVGVVLGAVFLWMVVRLHYEQTEAAAFRAFHASNAYLGLLLFAVVFDALVV
ncbi:protoheme IX farnesyltransferase [Halorubrum aidingense JCM 13560]|uniref:Protoheme IX farnesyltransferase n=1 Tax=Halorubrum aidingense JCM 13560 TaxID=1230454 RepID=M0PCP3_9EURY|nr:heme o synthase [Halorubrum aidingense]EMA66590.1 protoheme IX farnesyltransferase [Halorubrum aidingense JCM 13560]